MEFRLTINHSQDGLSAAEVLRLHYGVSRQMLKRIRLGGILLIDGQAARMIDRVRTGSELVARPEADEAGMVLPQLNPVDGVNSLFEDDHLIIVDKPPGLVVHPTFSHPRGTLTDLLCPVPLHPVNRIDRETSGLVIIAKHAHAHYRLTRQPIERSYWAFVHGHFSPAEGRIEYPIKRSQASFMIREIRPDGAYAATRYRLKQRCFKPAFDWLELNLETGRTHQIRVHCLYQGHPLLGDGLYGLHELFDAFPGSPRVNPACAWTAEQLLSNQQFELDRQIGRQALHAFRVRFSHPLSGSAIEISSPLPADMQAVISQNQLSRS